MTTFRRSRRTLVGTLVAIALGLTATATTPVRADGFIAYDTEYSGSCWYYYDGYQWLEAARYRYFNFRHTSDDGTTRWFPGVDTNYSGVCADDAADASGGSDDGWWMDVSGGHDARVFDAEGQQVYP